MTNFNEPINFFFLTSCFLILWPFFYLKYKKKKKILYINFRFPIKQKFDSTQTQFVKNNFLFIWKIIFQKQSMKIQKTIKKKPPTKWLKNWYLNKHYFRFMFKSNGNRIELNFPISTHHQHQVHQRGIWNVRTPLTLWYNKIKAQTRLKLFFFCTFIWNAID